jgi:hypothetical protein
LKIILLKLNGGLGNQMFQYAFAINLIQNKKYIIILDTSSFTNNKKKTGYTPRPYELYLFNLKYTIKSFFLTTIIKYFNKNICKINDELYFSNTSLNSIIQNKIFILIDGYFQSDKYFINKNIFKDVFVFKKLYSVDIVNKYLNLIEHSNSVAIHYRRGDYENDLISKNYHGVLNNNYYIKAMNYFYKINNDTIFFIFSDEIDKIKNEIIELNYKIIFIDNTSRLSSTIDMFLMSKCKHNIIANSTYSWWGAWLNDNENKIVIAPRDWYNSSNLVYSINLLIPDNWVII